MTPDPMVQVDCDLRDFPFMPLDVMRLRDSGIAATSSGDEFRSAVLLWCASWHQVPAASLPDDDAVLAQFAGFGRVVREWKKVREGALHGWIKCSDGRLYHPVIAEKARAALKQKHAYAVRKEVRVSAAKAAAAARWHSDSDAQSNALGDGVAMRDGCESHEKLMRDACESHTEEMRTAPQSQCRKGEGEGEGKEKNKTKGAAVALPDWLDPQVWADFREHRQRLRKPMTARAQGLMLEDLAKLRTDGHDPAACLLASIKSGWQGVFAPKPGAGIDPCKPAEDARFRGAI